MIGIGASYLIGKYGEDKLTQRSIDIGKNYIKKQKIEMSRVLIQVLLVISLLSCNSVEKEITDSYKNHVVKRLDYSNRSILYYNSVGDESPRYVVEYSGLTNGFSGYLRFNENGQVELLSGDGYFKGYHIDTSKFHYKRILAHEIPELTQNVCVIKNATRYEKIENNKSTSNVTRSYVER